MAHDHDNDRKLPIELNATCTFEKDAGSGCIHMMLTRSDVKDGGKIAGTIGITIGGGTVVQIDGCTYHISLDEIWAAVHKAHVTFAGASEEEADS